MEYTTQHPFRISAVDVRQTRCWLAGRILLCSCWRCASLTWLMTSIGARSIVIKVSSANCPQPGLGNVWAASANRAAAALRPARSQKAAPITYFCIHKVQSGKQASVKWTPGSHCALSIFWCRVCERDFYREADFRGWVEGEGYWIKHDTETLARLTVKEMRQYCLVNVWETEGEFQIIPSTSAKRWR